MMANIKLLVSATAWGLSKDHQPMKLANTWTKFHLTFPNSVEGVFDRTPTSAADYDLCNGRKQVGSPPMPPAPM